MQIYFYIVCPVLLPPTSHDQKNEKRSLSSPHRQIHTHICHCLDLTAFGLGYALRRIFFNRILLCNSQ
jgi:hypothetical protein